MLKHILVYLLLLTLTSNLYAEEMSNITIESKITIPSSYPKLLPNLLVNKEPELCGVIQKVALDAYYSTEECPKQILEEELTALPKIKEWNGLEVLDFIRIRYKSDEKIIENWAVPIPGENDENLYLIVYSDTLGGRGYAQHYLLLKFNTPPKRIKKPDTDLHYGENPNLLIDGDIKLLSKKMAYSYILPIEFDDNYYLIHSEYLTQDVIEPIKVIKVNTDNIGSKYMENKNNTICQTGSFLTIASKQKLSVIEESVPEIGNLSNLIKYSRRNTK